MELTSFFYILFVCVALLLYYLLPHKFQWVVLLVASVTFFFIMGTPYTFIYLLISIIVTWFAALRIEKSSIAKNIYAKCWFAGALVVNLGLLSLLKYSNFILANTSGIINQFFGTKYSWQLNLVAALGISFYTLQIVGYLLDCYWKIQKPQKNIFKFALFACFFPQMVSGPISRYDQLSSELYKEHKFSSENIKEGFVRIAYGIFKKLVIAENLNIFVSSIMGESGKYKGFLLILAMIAYVVQIYMDFAGCMDIVIGTAKCFDITMVENFNKPFTSKSIQEFWQRWHITLGLWLKDYVMYPLLRSKLWIKMGKTLKTKLGKNAAKKIPTFFGMLVLWFCMGLWHGGGWNYIFEGIWFWTVIVIGQILNPISKRITNHINPENRLWNLFQCTRTSFIYMIGAVFFYAASVKDGFNLLIDAFSPFTFISTIKPGIISILNDLNHTSIVATIIGFFIFLCISMYEKKHNALYIEFKNKPVMVCLLLISIFLYISLIIGVWGPGYDASQFIYGGF